MRFAQSNICTVKIRSRLQNDPFRTISTNHFFANYMYIFQKIWFRGHFEVSNMFKYQLDQWLQHKIQKESFSFFLQFVKKKPENLQLKNGHFMTISGHFFANYTKIFQKTEIQTVILRCLKGLNLN